MQLFGLRSIYISDKYVAWHFPFSVDSPLDIFFTIYAPLPFPRTKTTVLPTKTAQAAKPLLACSVQYSCAVVSVFLFGGKANLVLLTLFYSTLLALTD